MSTAGWLTLIGCIAVLGALWIAFTASRLDRLHARLDAAQSALDAQLVRRVAALRHATQQEIVTGGDDRAPGPVLDREPPAAPVSSAVPVLPVPVVQMSRLSRAERIRIEAVAQAALSIVGPRRQVAENEVGRAVAEIAARGLALSRAQRDELHESAVRVSIARRFYNDAVRDTRALRGRRMPRLLHLAGRRELPQFFDIDDTVPPELGRS